MTDSAFMLGVLRDAGGGWVSQGSLLARSVAERGHGFTPHSRAADLRKLGHRVECRVGRVNGRAASFYRLLVPVDSEPQTTDREAGAGALPQGSAEASTGTSSPVLFEVPGRVEAPAWG